MDLLDLEDTDLLMDRQIMECTLIIYTSFNFNLLDMDLDLEDTDLLDMDLLDSEDMETDQDNQTITSDKLTHLNLEDLEEANLNLEDLEDLEAEDLEDLEDLEEANLSLEDLEEANLNLEDLDNNNINKDNKDADLLLTSTSLETITSSKWTFPDIAVTTSRPSFSETSSSSSPSLLPDLATFTSTNETTLRKETASRESSFCPKTFKLDKLTPR